MLLTNFIEYKVIRVDYHSNLAAGRSEFYIEAFLTSNPRARPLRTGEYMKICEVLNISPVVKQKNC